MLKELTQVRQVNGEPQRRWFSSDTMDLIVWYGDASQPTAFQFCYDKGGAEKALTWRRESGFSHTGVDDGEGKSRLSYKETPILVANGKFDGERVERLFLDHGQLVPAEVRQFVTARLEEHRAPPSSSSTA
jgi:hypothetical protein